MIICRLMILLFVFLVSCSNHHLRTDKIINIEQKVQEYIDRYGIYAFFDEYYNLISKEPFIIKENADLAEAFGLKFERDKLPMFIKTPVDSLYYYKVKIIKLNSLLIDYFEQAKKYNETQNNFLKWHFLIYPINNSSITFTVKPNYYILGWSNSLILEKNDNFSVDAFGFYNCTAFIAVSDRYVYFQHNANDDTNELFEFLKSKKEDIFKIYIINGAPFISANQIKSLNPANIVFYHHKTDANNTYFVNISNNNGIFRIRHCKSGYIVFDQCESISGRCEVYFRLGRVYPKDDCILVDTEFLEYK